MVNTNNYDDVATLYLTYRNVRVKQYLRYYKKGCVPYVIVWKWRRKETDIFGEIKTWIFNH